MPKKTGHQDGKAAGALGAVLKRIRLLRDISLRALGERTDLSAGYLHKLEAGTVPLPSPHTLYALARELSADYRDLYILAGYPLPERPSAQGTSGARGSNRPRGSALGNVLRDADVSPEEVAEIADYIQYMRRGKRGS